MNTYFKILRIAAEELAYQSGNFPIEGTIPFGPPFDSKKSAKGWLKKNAENGMEYFCQRFYSLAMPEGLVVAEEKKKENPLNQGQ